MNRGKQFEQIVQSDLNKIPNSLVLRLPDQQSGYFGTSQNPCDFIFYHEPRMFMLECKSHQGNTFPLSDLRQYYRLVRYNNIPGLYVGVIIWFIDHDKIIYVPITTFTQMIKDDKKSINIKKFDSEGYTYYNIPITKKKVYLSGDYSILLNIERTEE